MPRRLRPSVNYHEERFKQISESHCGPAVIQMMLSGLGIDVTQRQVAEAGGATSLIAMNGMRVDQLARAVAALAPTARFYYKEHAELEEVLRIVQVYRYPVGVEWQGVFEDEAAAELDRGNRNWVRRDAPNRLDDLGLLPDSESGDNDYGHYSMVVRADRRRRLLMIADPYKDFFSQTRIFDYGVFERRWYDYNEITNLSTGETVLKKDERLFFIVTSKSALFPRRMGLSMFA